LVHYNKRKIKHLSSTKTKDNLRKEVKISFKPNILIYHKENEVKYLDLVYNFLPMFRGNIPVPSSNVKNPKEIF